ncbi:MAG: anti-sigma F factor [Clostridia bacterium]|nr:anti-sigma F factor [Clostridia bacterium]MBR6619879.1 anti-sigma F factor [Clostridia bacterium]
MTALNKFSMTMDSRSANEGFARLVASGFAAQLDPTVEELCDIKTAVSEAVTNCIVHAYPDGVGNIYISAWIYAGGLVRIKIRDKGCGIADVKRAMEPLYSSLGGERAGLGFAVMESFCDKISVRSAVGKGTSVTLDKYIKGKDLAG